MYQNIVMMPDFARRADKLIMRSKGGQWDPDEVLDWKSEMPLSTVNFTAPLISDNLAGKWGGLTPAAREAASRQLLGSLLGNLAVGEVFVDESLSALTDIFPHAKLREFLEWHIGDEVRHANVLNHYCDKIGWQNDPLRAATRHLDAATAEARKHWDSAAILVMVLEIAATAAIQGIRSYCDEPLTLAMLKGIVGDESRHISGMTLAIRGYRDDFTPEQVARVKDAVIVGWIQGLAVTEAPACAMSDLLDGEFGGMTNVHTQNWPFFRKTLSDILMPKLKLLKLLDEDLAGRLVAVGCPVPEKHIIRA